MWAVYYVLFAKKASRYLSGILIKGVNGMKGEKVVLEENVQSTFAAEYQDLLNVVRFIEGFGLLFVECSPTNCSDQA